MPETPTLDRTRRSSGLSADGQASADVRSVPTLVAASRASMLLVKVEIFGTFEPSSEEDGLQLKFRATRMFTFAATWAATFAAAKFAATLAATLDAFGGLDVVLAVA